MQQRPFDLGPVIGVGHFRAFRCAHVEAVDDAGTDGLNGRMPDVETHLGERGSSKAVVIFWPSMAAKAIGPHQLAPAHGHGKASRLNHPTPAVSNG